MAWYNDLWNLASETVSSAGQAISDIFTPETKKVISTTYGVAKDVVSTAADIAEIKQALQPQKGFIDPPPVALQAGSGRYRISEASKGPRVNITDIGFDSGPMRGALNNVMSTSNPSVVDQLQRSLRNTSTSFGPNIKLTKGSDISMPKVRKKRKTGRRYV
tara:strand:- start:6019 stop:6501 length:483 start_codon:yes stop_codon:yes gene_type:complete